MYKKLFLFHFRGFYKNFQWNELKQTDELTQLFAHKILVICANVYTRWP
jgi:hypothetical protein